MPDESITQKMKNYLTANQAKSVISKMKKRYDIYHAGQVVGRVLSHKLDYSKPSFVISGITPDSVERLGFECVDEPCLFTILDHQHVADQFIFGHVLSYQEDHMVADFMNIRQLSLAKMQRILTKIHQINHSFSSSIRLNTRDHQVIISQRLTPDNFAKTVVHLLEDQKAIENGTVILDDGQVHHF